MPIIKDFTNKILYYAIIIVIIPIFYKFQMYKSELCKQIRQFDGYLFQFYTNYTKRVATIYSMFLLTESVFVLNTVVLSIIMVWYVLIIVLIYM